MSEMVNNGLDSFLAYLASTMQVQNDSCRLKRVESATIVLLGAAERGLI